MTLVPLHNTEHLKQISEINISCTIAPLKLNRLKMLARKLWDPNLFKIHSKSTLYRFFTLQLIAEDSPLCSLVVVTRCWLHVREVRDVRTQMWRRVTWPAPYFPRPPLGRSQSRGRWAVTRLRPMRRDRAKIRWVTW